jgi:cellulose synthase/poly-beta-1,6-N-acetylglucosamine synthase-like glycosyltransferase
MNTTLVIMSMGALVAAVLLFVPSAVLLIEVASALGMKRRTVIDDGASQAGRPSIVVLVPAHDEAEGITATLDSIRHQLMPGDRLLVVADNCTDATSDVARASGAQVVERFDAERRGKGYALDHGVRALAAVPPEVVVIVDADCHVESGTIERLARTCAATMVPVQALYAMRAPSDAGLRQRIAAFAWVVRNQVRPLGLARWNLPCQLMGTGMAFPWPLLRDAHLASGHLVEDMQLGIDLALAGAPARFCPQASVSSNFPSDASGAASQRMRWEHGHLSMIRSAAPRLLAAALRRGRPPLLALALDLCVPPLAALVLALVALAFACAVLAALGGAQLPLIVALLALSAVLAAVAIARSAYARDLVSWADLLAVPGYVAAKVPLYARFLRRRQVEWVRTRRDRGSG